MLILYIYIYFDVGKLMSDDELDEYFSADDSSIRDSFNSVTETLEAITANIFTQSRSLLNVLPHRCAKYPQPL